MPASSDQPDNAPALSSSASGTGDGNHGGQAPGEGADGGGLPVVVTATLPAGVALHARPAAELVRAASRLQVPVTVSTGGKRANAKSILEILALGAAGGTEVTIAATGPGAAEAAGTLADLIANLGT